MENNGQIFWQSGAWYLKLAPDLLDDVQLALERQLTFVAASLPRTGPGGALEFSERSDDPLLSRIRALIRSIEEAVQQASCGRSLSG